ncbi:MAG: glycoside hydrolase family 38 C-terminal domain-containing protein [Chloroflexota bacterium]
MPEKPIVHLICNAHIDPIWKWTWEEGAREAISTFRTACDILDDYPTFIFNHNESLLYEWVQEYDPILFERIRAHVKSRRWNISGGWYLQPDVNLPSGETIVRCIIEGRRYFSEVFGVRPPVAYNFDSFGHPNSLPQLLKQSGFELYIHGRPYERQLDLPASLYKWRGADGNEVLALRPQGVWYMTPNRDFSPGKTLWAIDQVHIGIEVARDTGQDSVVLWGLGDHGGGPTREDLDQIHQLMDDLKDSDVEVRHSTPEAYLQRVKDTDPDIPVYEGELQRVLSGCYTSVAPLKREMRRIEAMLASAERWSALAWWRYSIRYPDRELREAWKRVMLNAFHDVLPGSLVEHALPGVHEMFGYAGDVARRIITSRQHATLPNVEPTPNTIPLYVLNPHSYAIQTHVGHHFLRSYVGAISKGQFVLYDDNGHRVIHQESGGTAVLEGTKMQPFIGFVADVPAMSARRYEIRFEELTADPDIPLNVDLSDNKIIIKTQWWQAIFDRQSGGLSQLTELISNQNLLTAPIGLQAMDDTGHAWGGMDRAIYNEPVGHFEALTGEQVGQFVGEEANHDGQAVRVIHHGPVSITIECLTQWQYTRASIRYTFYANLRHIDVDVRLYMQARQKMIKLVMPFNLPDLDVMCEVPYGVTSRTSDATEHPYHRWLRLETDEMTIGLANNGQAGFDVSQDGVLGLSLSRGAVHAKHDEDPLDPNISYTFIDQEQIDTRFRLIAGSDKMDIASHLIPLAHELNHPLEVFFVYHPPSPVAGAPAAPVPFLQVEPHTIGTGTIKKAETTDALIIRLYETIGQTTTATIQLDGGKPQIVEFAPHQIKTWAITRENNDIIWRPCNLLEEI